MAIELWSDGLIFLWLIYSSSLNEICIIYSGVRNYGGRISVLTTVNQRQSDLQLLAHEISLDGVE